MSSHQQTREQLLETLKDYLRIPSISTLPEHRADVRRAAVFTAGQMRAAGLDNVELMEDPEGGHPLVYGDWLHAPGKPTLLFYGHYDVQPADPLQEWITPPFEPDVRNGNIYARGAADDKGLLLILIKAAERVLRGQGGLPVNVRFLIEGEEESGGEHIARYTASRPQRLQAEAAVICDTEMFAPGLPTICVGLRGLVYGEIHVQGARTDLHSGVYGGAAPNPLQALAHILAALKDRDGRILIPGFHDALRPPTEAERAAWARLPFDERAYLEHEMKAQALVMEPGATLFDSLWARPTFEVHGIRGGFTGEGAKTVIPASAVAKVSARLVADQDPDTAIAQITRAVNEACPRGVTARFQAIHAGPASLVDTDNRFIRLAAQAMTEEWGVETVYVRSGGSIPIVGLFNEHLGIPSVMMGFGLPDDNLHAPNEKLNLDNFFRGISATARFLELAGA
ncbi:MAG: dipeptidase [Acidobacteria bacterium]|nr:dipeptidase [Acidobacteriota bacterium]